MAFHAETEKIVEALMGSGRTVAMTGAGISTASGIRDFRDPEGPWRNYDPSKMTLGYFRQDPAYLWRIIHAFLGQRAQARPNGAHEALAEMERMGIMGTIITQNLDGLHQMAGSANVIEFYGGLQHCYCPGCGNRIDLKTIYSGNRCFNKEEQNDNDQTKPVPVPLCEQCGGPMMPDIPLYDTPLDAKNIFAVEERALSANMLLVIGTSLTIGPIGLLPNITKRQGGIVAIINDAPTTFDEKAHIIARGKAENILSEIVLKAKRRITELQC